MSINLLTPTKANALTAYEEEIKALKWRMVAILTKINQEQLWVDDFATFADYLRERIGIKETTYRQWKASYQAAQQAQEYGDNLINEAAARALRTVETSARDMAIRLAMEYTGKTELAARDIAPIAASINAVLEDVATTGGYCDDGDGGMSAFEADVRHHITEERKRDLQQYHDRQKAAGWSQPIKWRVERDDFIPGAQPGQIIEIRWRAIDGG
jgi:hypothetical protein